VARNPPKADWQGGDHLARWTAAGLLDAENKFRKVQGYPDLWALAAELSRSRNPEGSGRDSGRNFRTHSTPQEKVA